MSQPWRSGASGRILKKAQAPSKFRKVTVRHGLQGGDTEQLAAIEAPADHARPTRSTRPVAIFVVVGMALLMSSLDQTIVATALHALQPGLRPR